MRAYTNTRSCASIKVNPANNRLQPEAFVSPALCYPLRHPSSHPLRILDMVSYKKSSSASGIAGATRSQRYVTLPCSKLTGADNIHRASDGNDSENKLVVFATSLISLTSNRIGLPRLLLPMGKGLNKLPPRLLVTLVWPRQMTVDLLQHTNPLLLVVLMTAVMAVRRRREAR